MKRTTLKDRTGIVYDRLTVVSRAENKNGGAVWNCVCTCGNTLAVRGDALQSGNTKSCGCIHKEQSIRNLEKASCLTHGKSDTKTYGVWEAMLGRCRNPNNPSYHNYGGRGVSVDPEWFQYKNFIKDMGEKPDGLTLERVNNELGYSKENCEWQSYSKQSRNKRSNIKVEYKGEEHCIAEWCDKLNLPYDKTYRRIRKLGWTISKAFETF